MGASAIDQYMTYVTAGIYWALVICWLAIIVFYAREYVRFQRIYPLLTVLLVVLFIDGARTLIESIYFGVWYTARTGLISRDIHDLLAQPYYVIIPKTINLIAALVIILVIVRRWFNSLEQEEDERRRAAKLRSELISLASHELRTPLTAITGYADTLIREFGQLGEATQKEFLGAIASESERLSRLISDLLDMTQIEERLLRVEPRPASPDLLCKEAVRRATHPGLRHTLRAEIAPALPDVLADSERIQQAMTNLISNAIKFSPAGSEVTVGARRANDFVELYVSDHGAGIPSEERGQIFTRFYRAANAHTSKAPGAGLGLYITKGIVEAHGGSIGFESQLGRGSTFHFTLPVSRDCATRDVATADGVPAET